MRMWQAVQITWQRSIASSPRATGGGDGESGGDGSGSGSHEQNLTFSAPFTLPVREQTLVSEQAYGSSPPSVMPPSAQP